MSHSGLASVLRQLIIPCVAGIPPDLHLQQNWLSFSHLGRPLSLSALVQLSVSKARVLYRVTQKQSF